MASTARPGPLKPKQAKVQRVGKYVLGAKVGIGGFGVVRKATDEETGAVVAVKILDKGELQLMQMTQQIKREITLLTTLKHPNIINGLEILNSAAKLYMVMEFVDGGDMHSLISERRLVPEAEARRYFRGLISCLAYCHERGVTHRDLKLENLLITSAGELKVCDFGLASVRALNSDANQLCSTVVGTEDFAAPEILQQIPYSGEKADMWSSGIILYTMLAGFCPFRGDDTTALFESIKSCHFAFPDHFSPGCKQVISSLLVAGPDKRMSAAEVLELDWMNGADGEGVDHMPDSSDVSSHESSSPTLTSQGSKGLYRDVSELSANSGEGGAHASKANLLRKHIQENPSLALAAQTIDGFPQLYVALRQSTDLVKDRRWHLRTFPKTFVGEDMVSWLALQCSVSRNEAVAIGERMLQAEVFHHVCRDHPFKDEHLFYRFAEDSPDSSVLNMRQLWPASMQARDPLAVSISLLNSLLALTSIYQAIAGPAADSVPEVDVEGLRGDEAFFAFRMAAAELQAVELSDLSTACAKMAFLVNVYHTMVLHIRILGGGTFRGRDQYKGRRRLEYNVAGVRMTLGDIAELIGSPVGEDGGAESGSPPSLRASGHLRGPKVAQPPSASGSGKLASVTNPMTGLATRSATSLLGSLSRRPGQAAVGVLRCARQRGDILNLSLSDGSPTCVPMRVFAEADTTLEAQRRRLASFVLERMTVDLARCTLTLPNVLLAYRKATGTFGERELLLHIIELLDSAHSEGAGARGGPSGTAAVTEVQQRLRTLLSSHIPVHLAFEEFDESCFAPTIQFGGVADGPGGERGE